MANPALINGENEEGFVGNLNPQHEKLLKELWKKYFDIGAQKKQGVGTGAGDTGKPKGGDGEDAFGGIAKDDNAKEEQKKKQDQAETNALLEKHGEDKFRQAFWDANKGDHPDMSMLRFLRARKWEVDRAIAMLAAAIKWRIDENVEDIVKKGEEGMNKEKGFALQMNIGKNYVYGTDKNGRPVVYIHVKLHKPKDQSQRELERYVIYTMETTRLFLTPPNEKCCIVFDLSHFGLSNMDWNCVAYIVKCLEAYYPESLAILLVHNAPWVFNAIWRILRPLLDPVVRQKVEFTKNVNALTEYIPSSHLPKTFGGDGQWEFKYQQPKQGENSPQQDEEKTKAMYEERQTLINEFEEATKAWIQGDDEAGKKRHAIAAAMKVAQHNYDPYCRGRNIYHRTNVLHPNSTYSWKYDNKGTEETEDLGIPISKWGQHAKELGVEAPKVEGADDGPAPSAPSGNEAKTDKASEGAAAGAAAGASTGAGAATTTKDTFHDAPELHKKLDADVVEGSEKPVAAIDPNSGKDISPNEKIDLQHVEQTNGNGTNVAICEKTNGAGATDTEKVGRRRSVLQKMKGVFASA